MVVELSGDAMGEFIDGLREVAQGNGDFCLTHGSAKTPRTDADQLDGRPLPFWFWPCFGHLAPDR